MSRSILVVALALLTTPAMAGEAGGKVSRVIQRSTDGMTYFFVEGAASGKPMCATSGYWIIHDENSEAGKKQYAMVLLAMSSGLSVQVTGRNSCTRWGDGEDVDYIQLLP